MQQLMVMSRATGEHVTCRADELATAPRALFPRSSAVLENALGELQRAYLSTNGAISLNGIQWFLGVSIVELGDVPDKLPSQLECAACSFYASLDYVNMADTCPRCKVSPFVEAVAS